MKYLFLFLFLFISQLTIAQTKLDLYNSAIQSPLLESLNEEQKAQVTAQLTKNEKLDPAINYYYLKGNFPPNSDLKSIYNIQRVTTAYIHNNYIKGWKEAINSEELNSIIFEYMVDSPTRELIVSDFKSSEGAIKTPFYEETENIKNYYRIIALFRNEKALYQPDKNYLELLSHEVDSYTKQLQMTTDSINIDLKTSFSYQKIIKTLIIQSLLNVSGNQAQLNPLEAAHKRLISAFNKSYNKNGVGIIHDAPLWSLSLLKLVNVSIGHSTYLLGGFDVTHNIMDKTVGGTYGVPFNIIQTSSPLSLIYAELAFSPFLLSNLNYHLKYSYLSLVIGASNPLININSKSIIDPNSGKSTVTNKFTETNKIITLRESVEKFEFTSFASIGLTTPLYKITDSYLVEAGVAYILTLNIVESQYNYNVSFETSYTNYPGHTTNVSFDEKTKTIKGTLFSHKPNPFIKLKTTSTFFLNAELSFGLSNSELNLFWRL